MSTQFAIVKMIEGETPYWSEFTPRYLDHAATLKCPDAMRNDRLAVHNFTEFIGPVRMGQITPERADAFKLHLLRDYAQNTARLRLTVIGGAFAYALTLEVIARNPFDQIDLPDVTFAGRILTNAQLKLLFTALPQPFRAACMLALYTGLRRKEIITLEPWQVQQGCIVIPKEKSKSGKERLVVLHSRARRLLGNLTDGRRYIFGFKDRMLNKVFTRAWQAVGIGRVRFHDLRHMAVTEFFRAGGTVREAMDQFGWSNPNSALPYMHSFRTKQHPALRMRPAV